MKKMFATDKDSILGGLVKNYEKLGITERALSAEEVDKICDVDEICEAISVICESFLAAHDEGPLPHVYQRLQEGEALYSIALIVGESLGEKYKLLLARALSKEPNLLTLFCSKFSWVRIDSLQKKVYSSEYWSIEFVKRVPEVNVEDFFQTPFLPKSCKDRIAEIILSKEW